jgi:hypothetical protein
VVAYEPLWAIGAQASGADNPVSFHEQALFIRKVVSDIAGNGTAHDLPVLYGGSVSTKNAADFLNLGQANGLEDFDNDATVAADQCRLWYPQVIDECYRDFPWPFDTKFGSLQLVSDPTYAVLPEWFYSYRVPVDCILVRRIVPAQLPLLPNFAGYPTTATWNGAHGRPETQASRIKYRMGRDASGMLIYTDFPPVAATATTPALPLVEYVMQQDDNGFFPADFAQYAASLLAFYIAPVVTGGDKFKLGARAYSVYLEARNRAQGNAMNEQQPDLPPDAEWIQAR